MTPTQARRASLRSLLAVERAARLRFSASVREVAERAARAVASGANPHAALVGASHLLEQLLGRDLLLVRTAARRGAAASFRVEALAAGLPSLTLRLRDDGALDRSRASAAAKAFAALWLARGVALLGSDDPEPVRAPSAALEASQARLEVVARTEPAQAWGDERDGLSDDYAEEGRGHSGFVVPLKVWDATLDRGTCRTCAALDGTVRPFGVDFPGGEVPGDVHLNCRCVEGILPLPVPGEDGQEQDEDVEAA
jgi:hypothetical protein